MAVEDFGGTVLGKKIEVVFADNQNKPDVGVGIVQRWLDTEHVDVIVDGGSSAVGMAMQAVTREKNKLFLISGSGTTALTNENCSPVGFQWSWDTYGLASGTATALVKQGLDTWFFITADYTFGHVLEAQAGEIVKAYGAKVLGSVRAPFNTADFSSFLLQAKASGAKVVALANAGGDAIDLDQAGARVRAHARAARNSPRCSSTSPTCMRSASHRAGADHHHVVLLGPHRGVARIRQALPRARKNAPTFLTAGAYSAVTHYLKAVKEAGTDETSPVAAQMSKMKINDPMTENGWIREDGRVMRDFYVVQVKTPAESKYPWDYYKVVGTVAGRGAALPLSRSECKLVKKPN